MVGCPATIEIQERKPKMQKTKEKWHDNIRRGKIFLGRHGAGLASFLSKIAMT
jgi:hypothetical protein